MDCHTLKQYNLLAVHLSMVLTTMAHWMSNADIPENSKNDTIDYSLDLVYRYTDWYIHTYIHSKMHNYIWPKYNTTEQMVRHDFAL